MNTIGQALDMATLRYRSTFRRMLLPIVLLTLGFTNETGFFARSGPADGSFPGAALLELSAAVGLANPGEVAWLIISKLVWIALITSFGAMLCYAQFSGKASSNVLTVIVGTLLALPVGGVSVIVAEVVKNIVLVFVLEGPIAMAVAQIGADMAVAVALVAVGLALTTPLLLVAPIGALGIGIGEAVGHSWTMTSGRRWLVARAALATGALGGALLAIPESARYLSYRVERLDGYQTMLEMASHRAEFLALALLFPLYIAASIEVYSLVRARYVEAAPPHTEEFL